MWSNHHRYHGPILINSEHNAVGMRWFTNVPHSSGKKAVLCNPWP